MRLLGWALFAAAAARVPPSGYAVPLHSCPARCEAPWLPALAGAWVVCCDAQGRAARVISLETGVEHALPVALGRPATGPDSLYASGLSGALVHLRATGPAVEPDLTRVVGREDGPPATDGARIAAQMDGRVQALEPQQRRRTTWVSPLRGGQALALCGPYLAWVVDGDGQDLWWVDVRGGPPTPLAGGPGDQRHVVASGSHLAWIDGGDVIVLHPDTGDRVRHPAAATTGAPPTLWADVACWEEPGPDGSVDVRCTDGHGARGPGHQRRPSRWGPWLLFHQGDEVYLSNRALP